MTKSDDKVTFREVIGESPDAPYWAPQWPAPDLLTHGEPVPRYARGVRNVLASPLTESEIFWHGIAFGEEGITAQHFEGLAPRIQAFDEADAVTAEVLNTVMEWKWGND